MKRKHEPRQAPRGDGPTTSAMIAALAAEGYDTVDAPFGHALAALAKGDLTIVGYGVAVVTQNLRMGAIYTGSCRAWHKTVHAERMIVRTDAGRKTDASQLLAASLPGGIGDWAMMADYAVMRVQARACL